jgi:hypothetical protein
MMSAGQAQIVIQDLFQSQFQTQALAPVRALGEDLEQAPVKVLVRVLAQAQALPRDRDQTLSAARDLIVTQAQVKHPVLEQALVEGRAQSQSQSQSQTQDLARALLQDQDQTPNVGQGRTATQALGEAPEQDPVKVLEQAPVEALVQSQSQTLE